MIRYIKIEEIKKMTIDRVVKDFLKLSLYIIIIIIVQLLVMAFLFQ